MSFQQQSGSNIGAVEAEQERRRLNEDASKLHLGVRNDEDGASKSQVGVAAKIGEWVRRIRAR